MNQGDTADRTSQFEKMRANDAIKSAQLNFGWVLAISFVVFVVGPEVREFQRWTNHREWLSNLHWSLPASVLIWCVLFLPWALIIKFLYRWMGWNRFRAFWIIFPVLLFSGSIASRAISSPPTVAERFAAISDGAHLPSDATDLRCYFRGGTYTPHQDTYCFRSSPVRVDQLIADLILSPKGEAVNSKGVLGGEMMLFPHVGDPKFWEGVRYYARNDSWRSFHMFTNAEKTKVYLYTERVEIP